MTRFKGGNARWRRGKLKPSTRDAGTSYAVPMTLINLFQRALSLTSSAIPERLKMAKCPDVISFMAAPAAPNDAEMKILGELVGGEVSALPVAVSV